MSGDRRDVERGVEGGWREVGRTDLARTELARTVHHLRSSGGFRRVGRVVSSSMPDPCFVVEGVGRYFGPGALEAAVVALLRSRGIDSDDVGLQLEVWIGDDDACDTVSE